MLQQLVDGLSDDIPMIFVGVSSVPIVPNWCRISQPATVCLSDSISYHVEVSIVIGLPQSSSVLDGGVLGHRATPSHHPA